MEFPFLEREAIEAEALELCCTAFGEPPLGPMNLDALLFDHLYERHGLAFFKDRPLGKNGEQDVLGITYPLKNEIHVDSKLAESGHLGRYRFTVAHEIGHWVLHRPLFLEAIAEYQDEQDVHMITLERDVVTAEKKYRPEEWQANHFAISLLLNDHALGVGFESRFGDEPLVFEARPDSEYDEFESLRAYSRHIALAERPGFPPLAEFFQLSVEATAIALEERGYVVTDEETP